jgi:hypothetical protein
VIEGWYYLPDEEAVHYVKPHLTTGGAGVTTRCYTVCCPEGLEDLEDFVDPELTSVDECCIDCIKEMGPPVIPAPAGATQLKVIEQLDIPDLDLDG